MCALYPFTSSTDLFYSTYTCLLFSLTVFFLRRMICRNDTLFFGQIWKFRKWKKKTTTCCFPTEALEGALAMGDVNCLLTNMCLPKRGELVFLFIFKTNWWHIDGRGNISILTYKRSLGKLIRNLRTRFVPLAFLVPPPSTHPFQPHPSAAPSPYKSLLRCHPLERSFSPNHPREQYPHSQTS